VPKAATQFACTDCGYSAGRWFGKCPQCGEFGTLLEEAPLDKKGAGPKATLRLVDVKAEEAERIPTGVPELDRVLGGGLVPASLVLVGGEPGVGKSTLLLTALAAISKERRAVLVTGEESSAQVKLRAARLGGAENVEILAETELDAVCATLEQERPDVCVIDSVQTLYSSELGSAPGSVGQVRESAARLLRVAKEAGVATILVGHVTKDGAVAGPRVLEHLVDCVLQFEGDRYHEHRVLRASKNRFGSTNELAVFEMTGAGLVGVPEPSELFGRTVEGEIGAACSRARGRCCSRSRHSSLRPTWRCRGVSAPGSTRSASR
jgi:DNA repair protein RadA/Sms